MRILAVLTGPRGLRKRLHAGCGALALNPSTQEAEIEVDTGMDICELKASLIYIVSPGQPKVHRERVLLVFKNKYMKLGKLHSCTVHGSSRSWRVGSSG